MLWFFEVEIHEGVTYMTISEMLNAINAITNGTQAGGPLQAGRIADGTVKRVPFFPEGEVGRIADGTVKR